MACRDFVKNDLPQQQSHSPQEFDTDTVAGLEREIDNDKARFVRGDGLEMSPNEKGSPDDEDSPDEGSMERRSSEEQPSFARSPVRTREKNAHFDFDEQDDDHPHTRKASAQPQVSATIASRPTSISTLPPKDISANHEETRPSLAPPRNHHRRATGGHVRLPAITMSSSISTAPIPTIRSRNRAISHPDISSLCQQLASSGPANRTTRYSTTSSNSSEVHK